MSDNIVSTSCSVHLCLILYWDDVCVAMYDIIVLTSYIVPSCLTLVFLHRAMCHVLTSWVYRHDGQQFVCTVQCNVISDFLYLHRELFPRIWYYCIYIVHYSLVSGIIVFTSCIVPSYLILLHLHSAIFHHIWYYCIYSVHFSIIFDIIVFTPFSRHNWHYSTYVMRCRFGRMWSAELWSVMILVWLMWLWWLRRFWWCMNLASSSNVVGITDNNRDYG